MIPDEPCAVQADFKLIIEKARKQATSRTLAQHTGQPEYQALDCCYCHAGLQEQTFGHVDALLRGLGLDPLGFLKVSTSERVGWELTSCSMHVNWCLRVAPFPHTLLRAGPLSFPSLPLSTTMDSL